MSPVDPNDGGDPDAQGDGKRCISCGAAIAADAELCPECGVAQTRLPASGAEHRTADEKHCTNCGAVINRDAELCPECGVRQTVGMGDADEGEGPDRVTAALLALLLGGIGAHRFYLGQTGIGVLYLCFSWTLVPALVGFVEGIVYLTKSDEEFRREYA